MNKRGHWVTGFLFALGLILLTGLFQLGLYKFNAESISIMALIVLLYSILPDIDHKSGTMTWVFLGVGIVLLIFSIIMLIYGTGDYFPLLLSATFLLIAVFISANFLPHRGIIHSIPAGLMFSLPLWFLFHNIAYPLLAYISWHSHLIADGYAFKLK